MPPLRLCFLLAALLTPLAAQGQPDAAVWRLVAPRSTALISVDWGRIRQSQAGAIIRDQLLAPGSMPAIPGMELLNEIDRVLISWGPNNPPAEPGESSLLLVVRGRFDAARVRQLFTRFGAAPQSYNSFQVYRPQGENAKQTAWVLFDAGTILFGDAPSVFAALDRSQFTAPSPDTAAMLARAAELDANYEIWTIMNANEVLSSDRVAALFQGAEWASEAQEFEAGVNLRNGLTGEIVARFASDAAAKRVTAELSRVMNLAAKDKSSDAQMQEIARKLKVTVEGSAAKISLHLTPQELEKSARTFAASRQALHAAAGATPIGHSTGIPAPLPTPAKPAVIRIEGLDEGTREIPYEPLQH